MRYCKNKVKIKLLILLLTFFIHNGDLYSNISAVSKSALKVAFTVYDLINDRSLKENDFVRVLGYYEINDGGDAEYIIKKSPGPDEDNHTDYLIDLSNGLKAILLRPKSVNYKVFGARGDGDNNDAVQIARAHAYANANNIPVINRVGEYWLKDIVRIIIHTDVDWGKTIFHIDEKYNTINDHRFEIISQHKPVDIKFSEDEKKELLQTLTPGSLFVPILEKFKNHFVVIADNNDRIAYRSGSTFTGQSKAREDFFFVEESGKIIGEITWKFSDYTKLIAYPVDKGYLNVTGGVFYLSGDSPSIKYGYYKNGINIARSKTKISDQWLGLEPNSEDTTTINPRSGFYSFSNVYDITLENVRLIPYLQLRSNGKNVRGGTYGISMGRVLKSRFKNVVAEASREHWGIFGTNLNKDFRIEDCDLNRVDVHYHCWNLSIINSNIGDRGITVTGGGDLLIENSSCSGQSFLSFRSDYGSRWNGDITIRNSTFKVNSDRKSLAILSFAPRDFDYKYPIRFGRKIIIEDFKIDFSSRKSLDATCWVMRVPEFSEMDHGENIKIPDQIQFENIGVVGREKGVRLITLGDQRGYRVDKKGGYADAVLRTNASYIFSNVELEDLSNEDNQYHFEIGNSDLALSEYSLYPSVQFINCPNIALRNNGNFANLIFDNCTVSNFYGSEKRPLSGKVIFSGCEFLPIIRGDHAEVYSPYATVGTFFSNSVIHPPVYNGEVRADLINKIGILKMNETVRFNHSNTALSITIVDHFKGAIDDTFFRKLMNSYQIATDIQPK